MDRYKFGDRTVRQQAHANPVAFRKDPAFNLFCPVEAIVTDIIYPDDERSQKKSCIEYNLVVPLDGMSELNNVPMAQGFGFYGDGEEIVLKASKKPAGEKAEGTLGDQSSLSYQKTEGDHVLVFFMQGSWLKPIIVARLPNLNNPIRSKDPKLDAPELKNSKPEKLQASRTVITNGTKVDIDEKGNLAITVGKHLDDNDTGSKKKITIFKDDAETPVLTISNTDGTWKIDFGGDGTAQGEKLVLGNALETFLKSCATAHDDHQHIFAIGGISVDTTTGLNTSLITTPKTTSKFPTDHTPYQSNWITSEQDAP